MDSGFRRNDGCREAATVNAGMGPRIREDKRGGAVYVCHGRDGRGLTWVGMGPRIREDKRGGAVYVCYGERWAWVDLGGSPHPLRTRGSGAVITCATGMFWEWVQTLGPGMGPRIREDKRGGAVYVCHGRDGRGLSWVGMGPRIREDKRGGAVCVCHGRDGRGLSWVGMGPRIREDTGGGQPQGIAPTGRCVANYFHSSGGSDFGALQAIL